ncbi:MAG: peptidase M3, partial [Dysgonamonadaceae bacterium]|nr:peptidase M3 [Dysgonamonadaceae bacterium]
MTACKDGQSTNPFFDQWNTAYEIPPFDRITVADYREAFLKGMEEQKAEIEAIVNNEEMPSFENTIVALDASGQLLSKIAGVFFAESSANGTEEILTLESEIIPLLTQHSDNIWMNVLLFDKVKYVREYADTTAFSAEDKRLLHETYLDFV